MDLICSYASAIIHIHTFRYAHRPTSDTHLHRLTHIRIHSQRSKGIDTATGTHTHTHTHTDTHARTQTHVLSLSLSLIHTYTHTCVRARALTHTHTHTRARARVQVQKLRPETDAAVRYPKKQPTHQPNHTNPNQTKPKPKRSILLVFVSRLHFLVLFFTALVCSRLLVVTFSSSVSRVFCMLPVVSILS